LCSFGASLPLLYFFDRPTQENNLKMTKADFCNAAKDKNKKRRTNLARLGKFRKADSISADI
jgi:hypothetical protein